jgi:hypothetical protein
MSRFSKLGRRVRPSYAIATLALVLAMSGSAAATVIITSTSQVSPAVQRALMGRAVAVHNDGGVTTSSASDTSFHSVATAGIPAGLYTATAKLRAFTFGGSGFGRALCQLTAHSAGSPDTVDVATSDMQNTSTVGIGQETLALEVAHAYLRPGTLVLSCQQNGLGGPGAPGVGSFMSFDHAKVIARQAGTLSDLAVTH